MLTSANWGRVDVWKQRAFIVSKYIGTQVLVQLLSMFSGLFLVHRLSSTQYAVFILAGTMQGIISVLSDAGVSSSLLAIGGRVWEDESRFAQVIKAGLDIRRNLNYIIIFIIVPVLWWMLAENHVGWVRSAIISFLVVSSVQFQISTGVLQVVPRLQSRFDEIQMIDLWSGVTRALLIFAFCYYIPVAEVALLVGIAGFGIQYYLMDRCVAKRVDLQVTALEQDVKEIKKSVIDVMPSALFYCVQGQIVILLVSVFGNTRNIAEIGALGRLAVIFTILSSMSSNILFPRFSKCQDPRKLKEIYFKIMAVVSIMGLAMIIVAWLLPGPLLWLLGSKYSHLRAELVYVMINSSISMIGSAVTSLNYERGWTKGVWVSIPIIIAAQIALIPFLNLSLLRDVLLLGSLPYVLGWIPLLYRTYVGIKSFSGEHVVGGKA